MANLAVCGGTPVRTAAFHPWPFADEGDLRRVEQVLRSTVWSSDGPMERELESTFAARHDAAHGIAVTNGSVSLLLCLRALGIKPGDEVIVPALTWMATATAVIEANGVPVFADVDPETLCMDPSSVQGLIGSRTIAIIPVHLYSAMAAVDELGELCRKRGLAMIEDCAHAHGAAFAGKAAGSHGAFGSFSFQSSKLMTAGEGGLVTCSDTKLANRVYSLKNCGRIVGDRGELVFATNHRMTEVQSALLIGQLQRLDAERARRDTAIGLLEAALSGVPGVSVQRCPRGVTSRPQYRLVLHYDKGEAGGIPLPDFVAAVRAEGIPVEGTYGTVYAHPSYRLVSETSWYSQRIAKPRCPIAEQVVDARVFTLPHQVLLGSKEDIEDVATAMHKVVSNPGEATTTKSRMKDGVKTFLKKLPHALS
jgi:dTDP-4-amino-4,6-dideoxygalactose transaminase